MNDTEEDKMFADLYELAMEGRPVVGDGARVRCKEGDGRWLAGVPYIWSAFSDRAFVFADYDQALEFVSRYRCLSDCVVLAA